MLGSVLSEYSENYVKTIAHYERKIETHRDHNIHRHVSRIHVGQFRNMKMNPPKARFKGPADLRLYYYRYPIIYRTNCCS